MRDDVLHPGDLEQRLQYACTKAAALPGIGHRHGHFRRVGAGGDANATCHRHDLLLAFFRVQPQSDQRHVVDLVDVGEVTEHLGREVGHLPHEALVAGFGAQLVESAPELGGVGRSDLAQNHPDSVCKHMRFVHAVSMIRRPRLVNALRYLATERSRVARPTIDTPCGPTMVRRLSGTQEYLQRTGGFRARQIPLTGWSARCSFSFLYREVGCPPT